MKSFLLFAAVLILSQIAFADANTPASQDQPEIMKVGPHKGEVIQGGERQNIKIVSQDGNLVTIANLRHEAQFFNAQIPLNHVTAVTLMLEHFNGGIVPAGHTMLRFTFDQPVVVTNGQVTEGLNDIVFSVEAVEFGNEDYGLITGLENHFAIAYRFLSLSDKAKVIVDGRKHKVEQYKLKLDSDQRTAVLSEALRMSNSSPMAGPYNTLRRSCTTELFRVLDNALHYNLREKLENKITEVGSIYPNMVSIALMSRGLYEGKDQTLNSEWCRQNLK